MTIHRRTIISLTILGTLFANSAAQADLIWIRGQQTEPISGQIISKTDSQIEFRLFANGKFRNVQTIAAENVEQTIITLDQNRLKNLVREKPDEYRDYAEELSAHVTDLAAIDLAKRLYLLAAYHSSGALRSGSILGLISLAESDDDLRRLKMFQLIIDPQLSDFDSNPRNGFKNETPNQEETQLMLNLVLALRQERSIDASKLLSSTENRVVLSKWSEHCTLKELDRIATVNRPSKLQLSKLLAIEVMIRQPENNKLTIQKQGWGELAMQPSGSLGVLPTFRNITPFDPEKSAFRNGRWVTPSKVTPNQ